MTLVKINSCVGFIVSLISIILTLAMRWKKYYLETFSLSKTRNKALCSALFFSGKKHSPYSRNISLHNLTIHSKHTSIPLGSIKFHDARINHNKNLPFAEWKFAVVNSFIVNFAPSITSKKNIIQHVFISVWRFALYAKKRVAFSLDFIALQHWFGTWQLTYS